MRRDRRRRHGRDPEHAAPVRQRHEPQHAAREPKQQRHDDEIVGRRDVHRHQEGKPAQSGAGQIGEIDAAEYLVGLEEHRAEEERAGQERQHVQHEIAEQPPLLHGIGDEEDGVEGNLLRKQIGRDGERAEQQQRSCRDASPLPVEPILADAHHRAGQAEAQHGEADHERAEMRPASDLEQAHDANLQRDHRAGHQADRQIERRRRPQVEIEVERSGWCQAHRALAGAGSNTWFFKGKGSLTRSVIELSVGLDESRRRHIKICRPWGRFAANTNAASETCAAGTRAAGTLISDCYGCP